MITQEMRRTTIQCDSGTAHFLVIGLHTCQPSP